MIELRFSEYASISLSRPTIDRWMELTDKDQTRSHTCHNGICENPYHSSKERQTDNNVRKGCVAKVKDLIETQHMGVPEALTAARRLCKHTPLCWPSGSLFNISREDFGRMIVCAPSLTACCLLLNICPGPGVHTSNAHGWVL